MTKWSKDNDVCMDMLSYCFICVIWGMDHVWQGWVTPPTTAWPPTTPQTCSAVTLLFGTKSLNHGSCQWCSGPRMMIYVWIYYPTVLWVWSDSFSKTPATKPNSSIDSLSLSSMNRASLDVSPLDLSCSARSPFLQSACYGLRYHNSDIHPWFFSSQHQYIWLCY